MSVVAAGALPAPDVLTRLGSRPEGLDEAEADRRRAVWGRNALRASRMSALRVLRAQFASPLLLLLGVTALASYFVGEHSDALIIGVILAVSVGLGFANEYRATRATEALHDQIRHTAVVLRDGTPLRVDVTDLVPGDVVDLHLGDVVPADLRLLDATALECDESVLTGESIPTEKSLAAVPPDTALADLTSCALMGTVVHAGSGRGVVVATADRTEFGHIAVGLETRAPQTEFQRGLRSFSVLLMQVALVLTSLIFIGNVLLHRPVIDALLFSLAIAVGITPQLLPAVVSTTLAAGSRQLARKKVLVKRLVCIEDLGDVDVLFTDKTGTLTEGHIRYLREIALTPPGPGSEPPSALGIACSDIEVDEAGAVTGGNTLDAALWEAVPPADRQRGTALRRVAELPFDHDRQLGSVVVDHPGQGRLLIVKGAPEAVVARSREIPPGAREQLEQEFARGSRVVAVATRPWSGDALTAADEQDLALQGFLVFADPPKQSAAGALQRLARLGITVKIVTGDNPVVARKVCADLGLAVTGVCTGPDVEHAEDGALTDLIARTTVFARVSPEQKARIVRAGRRGGTDVAFLGDGVNDAIALHAADVGISVDSATDVAKDAADVILLEKDLDVLADGVVAGRRVFANTVKYVLMGTASNFGNMVSAAGASVVLSFLPMLPSQILLNNLLYDGSQLAIPTDQVDGEQLARPSRWDLGLIRRFMLFFGPVSSLFDFATFGAMLWVFHAGPELFRTGWFVESLATQTLVIFVVRTRRVPFLRSRPSLPLLLSATGAVVVGMVLPFTPAAGTLGFLRLPATFFLVLLALVVTYLTLVELAKPRFFRRQPAVEPPLIRHRHGGHRIRRRAARFTAPGPRRSP